MGEIKREDGGIPSSLLGVLMVPLVGKKVLERGQQKVTESTPFAVGVVNIVLL